MFSNASADRLSFLENEARLADLEIERTPLTDIPKLDISKMTAGEIITLANVFEAIRVLSNELRPQAPAGYPSPATAERRGNYPTSAASAADEESLRKLRDYLTERMSEDPVVETVNGPIRVSEAPRDANGRIEEGWLAANCTCDDHEKKRIDADKNGIGDPSIATGLYL